MMHTALNAPAQAHPKSATTERKSGSGGFDGEGLHEVVKQQTQLIVVSIRRFPG